MKKIILVIALVMLLAFAPAASAATIPAGSITITAQIVDYVSALAGIAKPINTAHYENERVAVLVTIDVPTWYDTTNMSVVVDARGLSIDSAAPAAVATGNYLLFGTLYSTSGRLTVTLQDNALNAAASVQELWAALYGDRTVSVAVDFTSYTPASPTIEPPQTGDMPTEIIGVALVFMAVVAVILLRKRGATHDKI